LELNWINLEKRKVFQCGPNYVMVLGLEFCVDALCFGSNMHVECVALCISFPKCPISSKSEFGAKRYSCFSAQDSGSGPGPDPRSGPCHLGPVLGSRPCHLGPNHVIWVWF
jgi:hypothetical protein